MSRLSLCSAPQAPAAFNTPTVSWQARPRKPSRPVEIFSDRKMFTSFVTTAGVRAETRAPPT
jgi:hypothetical protein